jgi:hypothetical protein
MHPNQPRIGAEIGSTDIIGRHAWDATIQVPTDNSGITGGLAYSYAGLGLPIIDAFVSQDWSTLGNVVDNTPQQNVLGEIRRRIDDAELDASWIRQRYRSAFSLTAGTGVEQYQYVGVPNGTIALVDTTGIFRSRFYPRVLLGARYVRTQAAPYSISPEGLLAGATARERWRTDSGRHPAPSRSPVTSRSTSPGFAHHARRRAAGLAGRSLERLLRRRWHSGSPVSIIAGYTVGEGRRDFGVRGFEAGSLIGTRAVAGSAEYRLPLVMPGRGLGTLPFFLQRGSLSFFTDYGAAWCPGVLTGLVCTQPLEDRYQLSLTDGLDPMAWSSVSMRQCSP